MRSLHLPNWVTAVCDFFPGIALNLNLFESCTVYRPSSGAVGVGGAGFAGRGWGDQWGGGSRTFLAPSSADLQAAGPASPGTQFVFLRRAQIPELLGGSEEKSKRCTSEEYQSEGA